MNTRHNDRRSHEESLDEGRVIISADTHAGADIGEYRAYLPQYWHDEFDAWASAYSSPWDDIVGDTAARNWDSELRRTHMESDGITAEVIFPNTIPPFFPTIVGIVPLPSNRADYDRRWAGLQAHNRWLVDFCAELPDQRRGLIQVFPNEVDDAVEEIRWAGESPGVGGVLMPAVPPNHVVDPIFSRRYDPIWAACQEVGLPVCTHTGSGEPEYPDEPASAAVMFFEFGLFVNRTLSHLLIGGVFERFPDLKYTMTEQGVTWVPEVLARLDNQYEAVRDRPWLSMFVKEAYDQLKLSPREYFERNCFVGATSLRPREVDAAHNLGTANIMWGSDYPHSESTAPYSVESLRLVMTSFSERERQDLLVDTAAEVYGFDTDKLTAIAGSIGPTLQELRTPLSSDEYPSDHEWFLPTSLRPLT